MPSLKSPLRPVANQHSALIPLHLIRLMAMFLTVVLPSLTASTHTAAGYDSSRVVSIGGSLTEILYALGLDDRIVAVDTSSLYPATAIAEHPNVGYMRALSSEGVLSMSPTLILALEGAGPREALDVLQNASVPVVTVPDENTPEGIAKKIRLIGKVMGVEGEADRMARSVRTDLAAVTGKTAMIADPARVLFILSMSNNRILASGSGTAADAAISLAGGQNVLAAMRQYSLVSDEAILAARPDAILGMTRVGATVTPASIRSSAALARTPAVTNDRVIIMDGLYLLGFGPRTPHAIRELAAALYPAMTLPKLGHLVSTSPHPGAGQASK